MQTSPKGNTLQEGAAQEILGSLEDILALLKDDPLYVERVSEFLGQFETPSKIWQSVWLITNRDVFLF